MEGGRGKREGGREREGREEGKGRRGEREGERKEGERWTDNHKAHLMYLVTDHTSV